MRSFPCLVTIGIFVTVFSVLFLVPIARAADASVGFESSSENYYGYPDKDAYINLVRTGMNLGRDYVDVEVGRNTTLQEGYDITFPDGKRVEFDDDQATATLRVHIRGKIGYTLGVIELNMVSTWYMDINPPKSYNYIYINYPQITYIQFESATYGGNEGDAVPVVLTRSCDSSDDLKVPCSINIALSLSDSAVLNTDYSVSGVTPVSDFYVVPVSFDSGESRKVVTFNLLKDNLVEGTEAIHLNLMGSANAEHGSTNDATISIVDRPAEKPSQAPSQTPSRTPSPPTQAPSQTPSQKPSEVPSQTPSQVPSEVPSPTPQVNATATRHAGLSASPVPAPVPYLLLGVGAVGVLVLIALVAALGLAAGYLAGKTKK